MRLAVVSPFVDRRHGTERAVAELLERLARDYGYEIHLYSQRVEDLQVNDPLSARSAESGVIFWHKVPSVRGPHLAQFLAWMFLNGFLRKWHQFFGGATYDLVLSPGINCLHPDVAIIHALFHRLRELAREQEEETNANAGSFRRMHRRLYYGLLTALERRIYTDPKVALAAVSKRTAALVEDYFHRADVRVIPNGVDTMCFSVAARLARRVQARESRGYRDEDFILLLIGNDWHVKGLFTLMQAIAALPDLPIRLLVVGNDSVDYFRTHARRIGVQDRCHWELPRKEVLDLYGAADVYVSPSLEDSFGLPVAEAMACGLPVITSAFAGVADFVHDAVDGFVLREPRNPQVLAQLIQRLYADASLRRRIGEAAAGTITDWNWDRHARAVAEFLKDTAVKRLSSGSSEVPK